MNLNSKIVVFGASGLLGSATCRVLERKGFSNVLKPRSSEVNLLEKVDVESFLEEERPEYVFMLAGLVGGILGNKTRPADFLYQNSMMVLNLLEGVKNKSPESKILYVGSTCIYPRENPQPINEDRFMDGKLEETNRGYAVAKGLGIVACQLYRQQYDVDAICAMPTNMYGPNDTYDLKSGHMIPSLIKKFLTAKRDNSVVILWGSGKPHREALYSEDCADALIYLIENYSSGEIVNIGTGFDYSIKEFAEIIKNEIGADAEIKWDDTKPDGTMEKRTDISRLRGIYPKYNPRSLADGVREILENADEVERILD